jgi:hypothetical protein
LGQRATLYGRVSTADQSCERPSIPARALDASRCRGETVPDALLAHIAPLGWQNINLTGDYLWDADAAVGPHGFRSLWGAEMLRAEAA